MTRKKFQLRYLENALACDIVSFIMEVVTLVDKRPHFHYEELGLEYQGAIAAVNLYLLKEILEKIIYLNTKNIITDQ